MSLAHVDVFAGLAYIEAGKRHKKATLLSPTRAHAVILEGSRFVYVYHHATPGSPLLPLFPFHLSLTPLFFCPRREHQVSAHHSGGRNRRGHSGLAVCGSTPSGLPYQKQA